MNKYSYNCGLPLERFEHPTLAEIMNLIDKLKYSGKIFRLDFIKRTNGETRTMICRFGVKKHLKGGSPAYHFGDKGLLSVFDTNKQAYRSVPIDNILLIKFAGVAYRLNRHLVADVPIEHAFKRSRTIPAMTSPMYETTESI